MEDGKEFTCRRCGNAYPKHFRFGDECRWCFDERECCSLGGAIA